MFVKQGQVQNTKKVFFFTKLKSIIENFNHKNRILIFI